MPGWTKAAEENRKPKRRDRYARDPEYRRQRIEAARAWALANPERRFANLLRRRYGITVEQYNEMLEEQGAVCAICRNPETKRDHRTGETMRLSVDHCHATGTVRALLCRRCNHALGVLEAQPGLAEAMSSYLARDFGMKRQRATVV